MAQLELGNGFSIDFDDIDTFKSALHDQKFRLQQILSSYQHQLEAPPPGRDDYSGAWHVHADPAVKTYVAWNNDRQSDLQALIDRLDAIKSSYLQTEHHNTIEQHKTTRA